MALRLILYENSPEILDRLKSEGFSICSCVKDANAICYFTTPKWYRYRGVAHIHGFFLEEEPFLQAIIFSSYFLQYFNLNIIFSS